MTNLPEDGLRGAILTIKDEEIPFGAYQAIYHKLTKKTERDSKIYKGAYQVEIGDLESLHARLNQSIKQYQTKAVRCELTHAIKNESTRFHSSFEKFNLIGRANAGETQKVSYEFDFLIVLPPEITQAQEIAQRFKITVVIDQDLHDESSYRSGYSAEPDIDNIITDIEYSDYAVFQHLRAVIDEWTKGLPLRKPSWPLSKARMLEKQARPWAALLMPAAAAVGAISYLNQIDSISLAISTRLLVVFITLCYLGPWLIDLLATAATRYLFKMHPVTYLLLTTGDYARKEMVDNRKRKHVKFVAFAFLGIILTVLLNVFSSYLYELLT